MIRGKVLAPKFPEGGVEISDVDDVAGGVLDLDAIADTIRLAHKNEDPGDETFQGSSAVSGMTSLWNRKSAAD